MGNVITAAFCWGLIIYLLAFNFVTWFKYGFKSPLLYLHCFVDHWKKWLIFIPIAFVLGLMVKLILGSLLPNSIFAM